MEKSVLTFPKPQKLHGDNLTVELAQAGFPDMEVLLVDNEVQIIGSVTANDANAIENVVRNHTGEFTADQKARIQERENALTTVRSSKNPEIQALVKALNLG